MSNFLFWSFVVLSLGSIIIRVGLNGYGIAKSLYDFFLKDLVNRNLYLVVPDPQVKTCLHKHCKFYRNLDAKNKLLFERRTQKFIDLKIFRSGAVDGIVTLEMQTVVAAYAVQVTFGLPSVYLSYFDTIVVHPDAFISPKSKLLSQGELYDDQMILLAWNTLWEENNNATSKRNIALNLMGQALAISNNFMGEDKGCLDKKWNLRFIVQARYEIDCIAAGEVSFFSASNPRTDFEFFGAAVEYFFLCPAELFEAQPKVYDLLSKILQQDLLGLDAPSNKVRRKELPAHS